MMPFGLKSAPETVRCIRFPTCVAFPFESSAVPIYRFGSTEVGICESHCFPARACTLITKYHSNNLENSSDSAAVSGNAYLRFAKLATPGGFHLGFDLPGDTKKPDTAAALASVNSFGIDKWLTTHSGNRHVVISFYPPQSQ